MESYCINEFKYADETIKDGVCHGLKYRTIAMVGSCNDLLANLQLSILDKLGWEPKEREGIRFFTSISLTVLSGIQLLICTILTFYSAIETK
uniref:7TM_GPCR_Srx domain-containing protein n=1 Tax=Caenorhabditis tropicalis TaxID=1561998 RepID=A0A1I7UN65_9PELO